MNNRNSYLFSHRKEDFDSILVLWTIKSILSENFSRLAQLFCSQNKKRKKKYGGLVGSENR